MGVKFELMIEQILTGTGIVKEAEPSESTTKSDDVWWLLLQTVFSLCKSEDKAHEHPEDSKRVKTLVETDSKQKIGQ